MTFAIKDLRVGTALTGYTDPTEMGTGHLEFAIEQASHEIEHGSLPASVKADLRSWLEVAQDDLRSRQNRFMVPR